MELFRLLGTIAIDNTEANRALTDTTDRASDSESKLSSVFGKIGGAAVAAGKVIATGLAAASAAIAGVAKSALDAYADNEQLVGGVETLFGAGGKSLEEYAASVGKTVDDVKDEYYDLMVAQGKVFNYANEAYKTAGMSANEYMETVTSFSAALIKSLDNDTTAAAEKANQAIIDMSDNANKMGSSMESIQNAYNGFAKQNYTMLDNLKLGYGGTKEEMQRLLEDATAISNIEYDISSYADVVDAIHVIQEEMGIAGTTAAEASSTISGSIATMKSAWDNLLVGLAEGDADIDQLLQNLGESILTVFDNVIPRIQLILENIGGVIEKVMPQIVAKIPSILMNILPDLLNAAISMLTAIGNTIITQLPNAVNQIMGLLKSLIESQGVDVAGSFGSIFSSDFIDTMTEWIYYLSDIVVMTITDTASMLAEKIEPIKELFVNLGEAIRPLVETWINGLVVAFDTLLVIWNDVLLPAISLVIDIFTQLATTIVTAITPAIENISSKFQELQQFVSAAIQNYIVPTISMFIEMIQQLWQENQDKINLIGELFSTVFNAIAGIVAWFVDTFKNYIYPFLGWLVGIVQSNMDNIKAVFQSAFDIIGGIVQFFIALFKGDWQGMWDAIISIIATAINLVKNTFISLRDAIVEITSAIWSKAIEIWENIKLAITQKVDAIVTGITTKFTEAKEAAVTVFEGMKEAVSGVFEGMWNTIKGKINSILGGVETMANGVVTGINKLLSGIEEVANAAGELLGFNPISIQLGYVSIPRLAKGGIVTKSTIANIGEDGAEAIVPLENNTQWIRKVGEEMKLQGISADNTELIGLLNTIIDLLKIMITENGTLPETLIDAIATLRFDINNREFARLVKAVN